MEHKDQKIGKDEDGSEQVIGALGLRRHSLLPPPPSDLPDLFVGPLLPDPSIPWNRGVSQGDRPPATLDGAGEGATKPLEETLTRT